MPRIRLLLVIALLCLVTRQAPAQIIFDTTFDKYEHPKSQWKQWSTTKPGDFSEYSDGMRVFARFEAIEVGDHLVKVRTTLNDGFRPQPQVKEIQHLFNQDEPKFGQPTSVADDKSKIGDTEFAAQKWEYLGPDKKPIKEVWYSSDLPFDGMLKYQQYTLGQPSAERVVARFRKGEKTFGKVEEAPPAPAPGKAAVPPADPAPAADPPAAAANPKLRTWTSADGKQTIEAELVRTTATFVVLKLADGKTINLTLRQLSQADRDYVKQSPKSPQKK